MRVEQPAAMVDDWESATLLRLRDFYRRFLES